MAGSEVTTFRCCPSDGRIRVKSSAAHRRSGGLMDAPSDTINKPMTGVVGATSRDGRSFQIPHLSGATLGAGAVVLLRLPDGRTQLGQIEQDDPTSVPAAQGRVLG